MIHSSFVHRAALIAAVWFIVLSMIPAARAEKPQHVVLISVDGLAAYYLNDRRAPIPTLRNLARQGASAKGMITTFPSVTWPSHTSLVTGATAARHGVIGNAVIDRQTGKTITYIGDRELTKQQAIRVPTLYDVVHAAGMKTGAIIWPACNGADTLHWMIPDSNQQAMHDQYTTPGFAAELDRAGISIAQLGRWGWSKDVSAARDMTYARVTTYLLRRHQPNLILLHLITPDGVEHATGPNTEEAYWAVGSADDRIQDVWAALNRGPLEGKSALFVVSDHGFAPYDKQIQLNVLFREKGWIELDDKKRVTARHVFAKAQGGSVGIYIFDESRRAELEPQIIAAIKDVEGIEVVLTPQQFMKLGLPHPDDNPEQAHIMASATPGYSFSDGHTGELIMPVGETRGSHGHHTERDWMHAFFVAAGTGIKQGVKLDVIRNIDVAPTIAHLLGVEMPTAEGRVLTEILED